MFECPRRRTRRIPPVSNRCAKRTLHQLTTTPGQKRRPRLLRFPYTAFPDPARDFRVHLRRPVKRILRKHGHPPDKQEAAARTVLEQAEVLSTGGAA